MIVYFEANPSSHYIRSYADKNIFSVTFRRVELHAGTEKHGVFTGRITKQNWNQIIPRTSITVHFEFSAQHTYSMNAV